MTINEAIIMQKVVKERVNELVRIRDANLVEKNIWDILEGKQTKREEHKIQYDPKVVDGKVTELEIFLFKLDSAIKQANAVATVNISADIDKLLESIK